jgi:Ca2+/Na+ antiporter
MVPVITTGKSLGVEEGGMLNIVRRELEVFCLPGDIPEFIEIDISELTIGDSIHLADVPLGQNVEIATDVNYTVVTVLSPKVEEEEVAEEEEEGLEGAEEGEEGEAAEVEAELEDIGFIASRPKQIILILLGIAGVVGGAQIVVNNAVLIMTILGVDEKFIGLTIVAFGTSLPELATSVVAAMRGEMDISIGNLVGSNVFNIMSVLGVASLVRPIPIPGGFIESGLWIDYLVMMFTSFLPWLMMRKNFTVTRKDGFILLFCYFGYLAFLIVKA